MSTGIAEDLETNFALRDLSQQDEIQWQMPFEDMVNHFTFGQIAWSTVKHIFHDQHDNFRYKAVHKPFLRIEHMET